MKNCILFFSLVCLMGPNALLNAQDSTTTSGDIVDLNTFYDYKELKLSNIDTIPGFDTTENKLKISGTIYKSDGITPAKDVILYIEQADENGDFDLRKNEDVRYVHNRGWIKTNDNGEYTFFTYVPGSDRRYNQLQQLYPIIKEPSKPEYEIATFLFDEDPLLTGLCRKRLAKKGDVTRILKLKKEKELFVTNKDIVLPDAVVMAH